MGNTDLEGIEASQRGGADEAHNASEQLGLDRVSERIGAQGLHGFIASERAEETLTNALIAWGFAGGLLGCAGGALYGGLGAAFLGGMVLSPLAIVLGAVVLALRPGSA